MIDTDEDVSEKYEGLIDAEGYIDYDGLDHLLTEVKELQAWKAEVERICRTMNGPNRDTALFIMTNEVEEE